MSEKSHKNLTKISQKSHKVSQKIKSLTNDWKLWGPEGVNTDEAGPRGSYRFECGKTFYNKANLSWQVGTEHVKIQNVSENLLTHSQPFWTHEHYSFKT